MARYNEILVGRINRGMQKLLGMKGEPPAPQLSTEISTNLDLPLGNEFRYLEGWSRYGAFVSAAAVAAQTSACQIRNPATSNAVVVIESLQLRQTPASIAGVNLVFGAFAADLSTLASQSKRFDARQISAGSAAVCSSQNNVGGGGAYRTFFPDVNNHEYELIITPNQEFTILPGDGFRFSTVDVNVTLTTAFVWRERVLEESERT